MDLLFWGFVTIFILMVSVMATRFISAHKRLQFEKLKVLQTLIYIDREMSSEQIASRTGLSQAQVYKATRALMRTERSMQVRIKPSSSDGEDVEMFYIQVPYG